MISSPVITQICTLKLHNMSYCGIRFFLWPTQVWHMTNLWRLSNTNSSEERFLGIHWPNIPITSIVISICRGSGILDRKNNTTPPAWLALLIVQRGSESLKHILNNTRFWSFSLKEADLRSDPVVLSFETQCSHESLKDKLFLLSWMGAVAIEGTQSFMFFKCILLLQGRYLKQDFLN